MPAGECEGQVLGAVEAGTSGPPPGPSFSLGPQSDGHCFCKAHVCGRTCAACKDGFFGLDQANYFGCHSECRLLSPQAPSAEAEPQEGRGGQDPGQGRVQPGLCGLGGRRHGLHRPPSPPSCTPQTSPTRPGALAPEPGLGRVVQSRWWPPVGGESCLLCPLLRTGWAEPWGAVCERSRVLGRGWGEHRGGRWWAVTGLPLL